MLSWARHEPLQEKALAYGRVSKEMRRNEWPATGSRVTSCGEKTAEVSPLRLMFMVFGDQWDVSEHSLRAAGSSLFWGFKK